MFYRAARRLNEGNNVGEKSEFTEEKAEHNREAFFGQGLGKKEPSRCQGNFGNVRERARNSKKIRIFVSEEITCVIEEESLRCAVGKDSSPDSAVCVVRICAVFTCVFSDA